MLILLGKYFFSFNFLATLANMGQVTWQGTGNIGKPLFNDAHFHILMNAYFSIQFHIFMNAYFPIYFQIFMEAYSLFLNFHYFMNA